MRHACADRRHRSRRRWRSARGRPGWGCGGRCRGRCGYGAWWCVGPRSLLRARAWRPHPAPQRRTPSRQAVLIVRSHRRAFRHCGCSSHGSRGVDAPQHRPRLGARGRHHGNPRRCFDSWRLGDDPRRRDRGIRLGLVAFGLSLINVPGIVISVILGFLLIGSITLLIPGRKFVASLRSRREATARSETTH